MIKIGTIFIKEIVKEPDILPYAKDESNSIMVTNQELPDPSIITLKVTATIDVQFKSYGSYELNEKAKEQITIWVDETLKEEEQIPLFVANGRLVGEESISKTIKIEVK